VNNMVLAKRYAKALFAVAKEEGNFTPYSKAIQAVAELYRTVPELRDALTNVIYPLDLREKVMVAILPSMGLTPVMGNFLKLLVQKRRAGILPEIAEAFQSMVDAENNLCQGTVVAAMDLAPELSDKVRETLEKITGKRIVLTTVVDPSIIGGIVAKVGDLVLDGSIRSQLAALKESIKGS